jgi:hypothetical protein
MLCLANVRGPRFRQHQANTTSSFFRMVDFYYALGNMPRTVLVPHPKALTRFCRPTFIFIAMLTKILHSFYIFTAEIVIICNYLIIGAPGGT